MLTKSWKRPSPISAVCRQTRSAFTLIELLVVVGIIAVLVALLVPALTESKRTAMLSSCASNVRQLSMASVMYAQTNDTQMIPYNAASIPGGDQVCWAWYYTKATTSYSYAGSWTDPFTNSQQKVLICPEMINGANASNYSITGSSGKLQCNYGIAAIGGTVRTISAINTPQDTFAFGDSLTATSSSNGTPLSATISALTINRPSADQFTGGTLHGRHLGNVANVGFLDGHVEPLAPQLRPASTLFYTVAYPTTVQYNLGSLCYGTIDPTQFTTRINFNSPYATSTLDYYFWADKSDKK